MPNYNKIFLQRTLRIENEYVTLIAEAIRAYRSSFLTDLRQYGPNVARTNLSPYSDSIAKLILPLYRTAGALGANLTRAELTSLLTRKEREWVAARGQKSASFGIAEAWIQSVIDFLKLHLVRLVSRITETMRDDIAKVLEKGIAEQWSIDQIAKELEREDIVKARARVIARTEVIRAANVGHQVSASKTPYEVDKRWSAAEDERTRIAHRETNGHITSEHGTFQVPIYKGDKLEGSEPMERPGDPNASPGNTINCRCRAQFIPKRDANGRLIARSAEQAQVIPINRIRESVLPDHQIAAILKAHAVVKIDN